MAFLEKVFRRTDDLDMDEFLNRLDTEEEDDVYADARALVKPIELTNEKDVESVVREVQTGNFVLLNIGDMRKRNLAKLRELISSLKNSVEAMKGDLALVSQEKVLVTPSQIKIVKRKM